MRALRPRAHDLARQATIEQVLRYGSELRTARVSSGITQQRLARRAGVSQALVSLIERGRRVPSLHVANRLATACGCQLWLRLYPAEGVTLRDSGQLGMATVIVQAAHRAYRCRIEVPVGIAGDRRAHDLVMDIPSEVIAVELERGFADMQAQVRAAQLKRRALADRSELPVRLVIAAPDTPPIRRLLRDRAALLGSTFPVPSRAIWRAIRTGQPIGGDGILLVPNRGRRVNAITPSSEFGAKSPQKPADPFNRLPKVMDRKGSALPDTIWRATYDYES